MGDACASMYSIRCRKRRFFARGRRHLYKPYLLPLLDPDIRQSILNFGFRIHLGFARVLLSKGGWTMRTTSNGYLEYLPKADMLVGRSFDREELMKVKRITGTGLLLIIGYICRISIWIAIATLHPGENSRTPRLLRKYDDV